MPSAAVGQVLEGLSERVVASWLPLLHRAVDAVALLDMLASFATLAVTEGSYVRPALTEGGGPLAIVEGRHPIVEALDCEAQAYVPNDTYLAFSSSFHVITGPNGLKWRPWTHVVPPASALTAPPPTRGTWRFGA